MGIKHVEAFGDSLLVVQQIVGAFQCFDGSLNAYLDKWLEIVAPFDDFTVQHVFRDENIVANDLAHQASCFDQIKKNLVVWKNRMFQFIKPDSLIFSRCAM
jgi:hypothetical protein